MTKLTALFLEHWKVVSLTFEVFWIVVFVLEASAGSSGREIPQFVYANF